MSGTSSRATIVVDRSHLGRRGSGIERVTAELFSAQALAPLPVDGMNAGGGRLSMVFTQMARNPLAAWRRPDTIWIFPGYPPSPLFSLMPQRSVLYVHDLFLMTRRQDLNRAARLYMAAPFRIALRSFQHFFVLSLTTGRLLAPHVSPKARIIPYRPRVENVFGLGQGAAESDRDQQRPLIVGAIGTVEPRKNFLAAARACQALERSIGRPVELHIVGRRGWGGDFDALAAAPHVRLHGFVADDAIGSIVEGFDVFLCTSHDEGLGLPLLEVQHAGLPVIAPDQPVFREVLAGSGTYIRPDKPESAAAVIAAIFDDPDWRLRHARLAADNISRWNAAAEADRKVVIAFLAELCAQAASR